MFSNIVIQTPRFADLKMNRKGMVQTNLADTITELLLTLNVIYWPPVDHYSVILALLMLRTKCVILN
jgi:hypothetical protein